MRFLRQLPEKLYDRDHNSHIKVNDRRKGDNSVADAEKKIEKILDERPEGDLVNSLLWMETNCSGD